MADLCETKTTQRPRQTPTTPAPTSTTHNQLQPKHIHPNSHSTSNSHSNLPSNSTATEIELPRQAELLQAAPPMSQDQDEDSRIHSTLSPSSDEKDLLQQHTPSITSTSDVTAPDPHLSRFESSLDKWTSLMRKAMIADFSAHYTDITNASAKQIEMVSKEYVNALDEIKGKCRDTESMNDMLRHRVEGYRDVIENAGCVIGCKEDRRILEFVWHTWRSCFLTRRADKKMMNVLDKVSKTSILKKSFLGWRRVVGVTWRKAMEKRITGLAEISMAEMAASYEAKLAQMKKQLEVTEARLTESEIARARGQQDMKQALMRGVCALNMEAMSVFKENESQSHQPSQTVSTYPLAQPSQTPSQMHLNHHTSGTQSTSLPQQYQRQKKEFSQQHQRQQKDISQQNQRQQKEISQQIQRPQKEERYRDSYRTDSSHYDQTSLPFQKQTHHGLSQTSKQSLQPPHTTVNQIVESSRPSFTPPPGSIPSVHNSNNNNNHNNSNNNMNSTAISTSKKVIVLSNQHSSDSISKPMPSNQPYLVTRHYDPHSSSSHSLPRQSDVMSHPAGVLLQPDAFPRVERMGGRGGGSSESVLVKEGKAIFPPNLSK